MTTPDLDQVLIETFLVGLQGNEAETELLHLWLAHVVRCGLPPDHADRLQPGMREGFAAKRPRELPEPRLHVDLGHHFEVGHAVSVEFHLICPGYEDNPKITARINPGNLLDLSNWKEAPEPRRRENGFWAFIQSFSLRDPNNPEKPCAPGNYHMELELEFRADGNRSFGRFLWAELKFEVFDPKTAASRTLEISGDGMSIIDLENCADLTSFGRVVITGRDKSIISVSDRGNAPAPVQQPATNRYYQLPLRRHHERHEGGLFLSPKVKRSTEVQPGLALNFEQGERVLVYPKEKLQFGRHRQNDVVLRFVPGSNDGADPQYKPHDDIGRSISKVHFEIKLSRLGLEIKDLGSSFGTRLGEQPLPANQTSPLPLNVGELLHVGNVFQLLLSRFLTFTGDDGKPVPPDEKYLDAIAGDRATQPLTWKLAQSSGIDAVRISRVTNLPNEHYVMLFRQALIGFDPHCAIRTPFDDGVDVGHIARLFYADGHCWCERLVARRDCPIRVDGHDLNQRELIPVLPGQRWQFGESTCVIEPLQQDLTGYP